MDPSIYKELAEQEQTHWWFLSRRTISRKLLSSLHLPKDCKILEAGCGSGGNLPMLSDFGRVFAFEMNEGARTHALARGIGQVAAGKLPDSIPFAEEQFDLIALFDVLEHIDNDYAALSALAKRLKTGGAIFICVPAFKWLHSPHDELHHHRRRYGRAELKSVIKAAGLRLEFINYWNFFLFPVAVCVRLASSFGLFKNQTPGAKTPSPALNKLIATLVSSERYFIPFIRLPFGLSLIAVARPDVP